MTGLLLLLILTPLIVTGGLAVGRFLEQHSLDQKRRTYRVDTPAELDPERVTAWLRSLSGTLRTRQLGHFFAQPSIALEVWATSEGIVHRLKVPFQYEPMIRPRLESLVPGIRLTPEDEPPTRVWVHAAEFGLRATDRQLKIPNAADLSHNILTNFSALAEAETLMMQWVVGPAVPQHKPEHGSRSSQGSLLGYILGSIDASKDEVQDRREKLSEPNMQAVLRVAATAATPIRAQYMVRAVMSSLDSARGPSTRFFKRMVSKQDLQQRVEQASTPFNFPALLSAPELSSVLGWRFGTFTVPGMPAPVSRRLPASNTVPSAGIILGRSNTGTERPVALGYREALTHQWIVGPPGVGKTALLANQFKQIVNAGYGAVVIESKGDLFNAALNYIPPDRMQDVIILDVNDTKWPVGFNILRQGDSAVVVDELNMLFNQLYRNDGGVWFQELLYHGLHTLAADKRAAFTDLASLISPAADELEWRDELIRNVKDPQMRNFWQRFDNQPRARQDQIASPVLSRVWQLSRSKLLNIVGQSESSFQMADVVQQNKILLVNLANIERDTASLMGTLIVQSLWHAVKNHPMPNSPNFLMLDEAHHYVNLPLDLELMLVEARSMGLGMVFAHQHMAQLPPDMKQALMHSAQTKLVFQTSGDDARHMANLMGKEISDDDLMRLAKYEVVGRIATPAGVSPALTLSTYKPAKGYDLADRVVYASRGTYGRPVNKVMDDIIARRTTPGDTRQARKPKPFAEGWGGLG